MLALGVTSFGSRVITAQYQRDVQSTLVSVCPVPVNAHILQPRFRRAASFEPALSRFAIGGVAPQRRERVVGERDRPDAGFSLRSCF